MNATLMALNVTLALQELRIRQALALYQPRLLPAPVWRRPVSLAFCACGAPKMDRARQCLACHKASHVWTSLHVRALCRCGRVKSLLAVRCLVCTRLDRKAPPWRPA